MAWKEALKGRVSLDSLRFLTTIVDKVQLIKLFGMHDQDMTFSASIWQILKARPLISWLFGNKLIELILFIQLWQIAWRGVDPGWGWALFLLVCAYYGVCYLIYLRQLKKVQYQLAHEHLKKYGPKAETGFRFDHLGATAKPEGKDPNPVSEKDEDL